MQWLEMSLERQVESKWRMKEVVCLAKTSGLCCDNCREPLCNFNEEGVAVDIVAYGASTLSITPS